MQSLTAKPGTGITLCRPGRRSCRPGLARSAVLQEMRPLTKQHHWSCYWDRYNIDSAEEEKGWVGSFKAFEPRGSTDEDIRFQEQWFRLMKSDPAQDQLSIRYIRKGGPGSWPRKGKDRPDGYEETRQTHSIEESSFDDGFWHPHGRFPGAAPTRVVGFGPEALAQVSLSWPSQQQIKDGEDTFFIGGCEVHFHSATERTMLLVGYMAKDDGGMYFHGHCWDPVFVHGVVPDSNLDIDAELEGKEPRPQLSANPADWPIDQSSPGTSQKLVYDHERKVWTPTESVAVQWKPPAASAGVTKLFTYRNGAFAMYPDKISPVLDKGVKAQMGLHCGTEGLKRVLIDYFPDGRIDGITLEQFPTTGQ